MQSEFALSAHWTGGFDEPALQRWAEDLRRQLRAPQVSLGLVFLTPRFFPVAQQVLELLRVHAQIPLLAGCSSHGLIAGREEFEENAGLVLGLYHLPGAKLHALHFRQEQVEAANGPGDWHLATGLTANQTNGWLVFADPFHLDCEAWLRDWNEAYPERPTLGGLAGGDSREHAAQVYLNGEVFDEGGVAVAVGGAVGVSGVISQGCTPIGETWTITKAERNLIHQIGNRPAYQVMVETYNNLSPADQQKTRGNLFVGLVINEYLEDFHRGDFLVRNLIGADPASGCVAVGALPRQGQTVQFQRRDADAASEDLTALLDQARRDLAGTPIYGACLCSCNGRGHRLFGRPHHDANLVQQRLGPLGLTGFFCNGEIGPVGERNFLHGYTASLALFVGHQERPDAPGN
ncbi:MAG: FIST C-terminal domain-containing protein [Verrucomicrobia bacterium]|nr:FIST C-terminal domain-containing protein [Verrucomicrobiota bacterium]